MLEYERIIDMIETSVIIIIILSIITIISSLITIDIYKQKLKITIELYKHKLKISTKMNNLMAEYIEYVSSDLLTKEQLLEQFENEAKKQL